MSLSSASTTFFKGLPYRVHYVASKGVVIGLTRSLASEMGEYTINGNCIAPDMVLSKDPTDQNTLRRHQENAAFRIFKRIEYPDNLVGAFVSSYAEVLSIPILMNAGLNHDLATEITRLGYLITH